MTKQRFKPRDSEASSLSPQMRMQSGGNTTCLRDHDPGPRLNSVSNRLRLKQSHLYSRPPFPHLEMSSSLFSVWKVSNNIKTLIGNDYSSRYAVLSPDPAFFWMDLSPDVRDLSKSPKQNQVGLCSVFSLSTKSTLKKPYAYFSKGKTK